MLRIPFGFLFLAGPGAGLEPGSPTRPLQKRAARSRQKVCHGFRAACSSRFPRVVCHGVRALGGLGVGLLLGSERFQILVGVVRPLRRCGENGERGGGSERDGRGGRAWRGDLICVLDVFGGGLCRSIAA